MFKAFSETFKTGYKANALSPYIWFICLSIILLLVGIKLTDDSLIRYLFVGTILILLLFGIIMGVAIFIKDPKLLQTEKYRTNDRILDLVEQKGGEISINPVTLDFTYSEYVESPELLESPKKLTDGDGI